MLYLPLAEGSKVPDFMPVEAEAGLALLIFCSGPTAMYQTHNLKRINSRAK